LGAVDLSRVIQKNDDGVYFINWNKLSKTIFKAVRFLDNIIDLNDYHDERIEKQHKSDRRIGLGTMGLGELLIKMKIKYGKEAVEFLDDLYGFIATQAYLASIELAKEKGPFPMFDAEKYLQSEYIKNLPDNIREQIAEFGIRNAVILTQAPNGTTGTMMGTSTGIEPFYAWTLTRASRLGVHEEKAAVLVDIGYADSDDLPEYCVTAMDMSPEDHLAVQAIVQRWIDSAISKTTNVPAEWTVEQVDELYRKAWLSGCKGITIYRDGSRHEQVLTVVRNQQTQDNNCEACGEVLVRADGCISCPNGCFSACSL
jgi:ribonucleoside-diphosphate reductase alpha chain